MALMGLCRVSIVNENFAFIIEELQRSLDNDDMELVGVMMRNL